MGQSLKKPTATDQGAEKKIKEIGPIIEKRYDSYSVSTQKTWQPSDFHQAVSETVEEINKKMGHTQFRVPPAEKIKQAFEDHQRSHQGKAMTKEEFQGILQNLILATGFTGIGARDILMYIFGIPIIALFIKQKVAPQAIPNEIFIPGVTSGTVFLLAKLNKI